MTGQRVGYIRVSTVDQNIERQLDGITYDKCFIDYASGKNIERPEFKNMMNYVREGDVIVVHSMDRLARSLKDLVGIVDDLIQKGIAIEFLKERITFTAQSTAMDNLMLQLMGAFAEFERSLILERQREGIRLAAAKGKYKGRAKALKKDQAEALNLAWQNKEYTSKAALGKAFGITRQTVYKYLK
ncbi:recombinase family protein [Acinetobacter sp. HY1485]|uniref:recombinase family protein n=1 Tax=Acinetobacter sp. HY1485 TaxID=2970918 RepID=UPI0022B9A863|nr:recombinase family protein [Acinetobacter sp. HY1485]